MRTTVTNICVSNDFKDRLSVKNKSSFCYLKVSGNVFLCLYCKKILLYLFNSVQHFKTQSLKHVPLPHILLHRLLPTKLNKKGTILFLSLYHPFASAKTHTHTLTLFPTNTHSLSLSYIYTHTLILTHTRTQSLSLYLSHTYSISLHHIHILSHTQTHTNVVPLSFSSSYFLSLSFINGSPHSSF